MKKFVAFALVLAMAFALCACTPNEDKDDFKVGVILVGDENEG